MAVKQKKKSQSKKAVKKTIKNSFKSIKAKVNDYLKRRPHRSFRRTRRRDYVKKLKLPGYRKFAKLVFGTLWKNKKIFLSLALLYAILSILIIGLASQDTYLTLTQTIKSTSGNLLNGFWGEIGKASLLFVSTASGSLNGTLSEAQTIYAGIIVLMTWLTTVWLLRNILAGHKVKIRDGLYNGGSPILPTFLVALLVIVQLLPAALAFIGYGAAASTGILDGGVEAMLFWFAAISLVILSLYLVTSTFFALVIITLPGMYPMRAIKLAGDIVIGNRIKILLRLLWMLATAAIVWALVMIPIIIFDNWIKSVWVAINWFPTVPILLLILTSISIIWIASYIYLLYRKVVANESNED